MLETNRLCPSSDFPPLCPQTPPRISAPPDSHAGGLRFAPRSHYHYFLLQRDPGLDFVLSLVFAFCFVLFCCRFIVVERNRILRPSGVKKVRRTERGTCSSMGRVTCSLPTPAWALEPNESAC